MSELLNDLEKSAAINRSDLNHAIIDRKRRKVLSLLNDLMNDSPIEQSPKPKFKASDKKTKYVSAYNKTMAEKKTPINSEVGAFIDRAKERQQGYADARGRIKDMETNVKNQDIPGLNEYVADSLNRFNRIYSDGSISSIFDDDNNGFKHGSEHLDSNAAAKKMISEDKEKLSKSRNRYLKPLAIGTGAAATIGGGAYLYNRYKKKKRADAEEEKTAGSLNDLIEKTD